MLRALLLLFVFVAAPAAAQEYQSKELADAARDWRQELIDSVPANKKQPNLVAALRRTAEVEYQGKDYKAAIGKLTGDRRTRRRAAPARRLPRHQGRGSGRG